MKQQQKYKFLCALALVCGLLFLASCNATDVDVPGKTPVVSAPPANTTYPMPPLNTTSSINGMGWELSDGKHTLFSDYKGKVLVLDFYATWCNPCRKSVPHLIGLQKKYETQGLQVIGLNVGGPGDYELVPGFARELGIHYPLAIPDEELVTFLLSDSDAIPQTFVFDREGLLVDRLIGFGPSSGKQLDEAVESALKTTTTNP
ncbi:MAG TPA: TlpA disulfide reductase family protein [Pyrinomonadaceae bacterium]|nr:TlpA disulfide reductase family protein [Pyrinomonadaceae bacterium]